MANIQSRTQRETLLKQIEGMTREKLEELINQDVVSHGGTNKKPQTKKKELSTEDRRIVEAIQRKLGAKVKLTRKPGRAKGGSLTLEFCTSEDVEELFKSLA